MDQIIENRFNSLDKDISHLDSDFAELSNKHRELELENLNIRNDIKNLKTNCPAEGLSDTINDKMQSRDKVLGFVIGLIITLSCTFGSVVWYHNITKLEKEDFKTFISEYHNKEEKRDAQINQYVIKQTDIQRELLDQITEIKINLSEMNGRLKTFENTHKK